MCPRIKTRLSLVLVLLAASSALGDDAPDSPLVKILKKGGLPEERQGAIVEMVVRRGAEGGRSGDLGYVFEQVARPGGFPVAVRRRAVDALAEAAVTSKTRPSGDLAGLKALIGGTDPAVRLAAIRLAGLWKVEPLAGDLGALATAQGTPGPVRAAALGSLAEIGGEAARKTIADLTGPGRPTEVRALAVAALARLDLAAGAKAAVGVLRDAGKGQDFAPMLAPFLNLKGGVDALAAAVAGADLPPDPAKLALRAVYALGRSDAAIVDVLNKAAKLDAEVKAPDKAEVDRLIAEVAARGDAARGELVFRRADLNCTKCHALAGAAGGVGPELTPIGATSPVDYLINSVMVPDQAIKEEFVTKVVQMADGRVYYGIVVDRDDNRLVLREATGETRVLPAEEVEDSKDGGSLMPKGLVNFLTRAEFVDLLRFLSELGKPGPYAVHSTPTIQRWRLLKSPGDVLSDLPVEFLEGDESRWVPAYSLSTGVVPLGEFSATAEGPVVLIRGEVKVSEPGPVTFSIGSERGVKAWVDDKPVTRASSSFTADLAPGLHGLVLRVDTKARGDVPLKVEVTKPAGSSAEFTVVGGR